MFGLFLFLVGCAEPAPTPLPLEKGFYEWTCKDYENHSEIIVTTNTCEDLESGLYYMVAEYHMYNGVRHKRHMTKSDDWIDDCVWNASFYLIDDVCIGVNGVTLTAYIGEATLFGD
jgi:hypothetical protein